MAFLSPIIVSLYWGSPKKQACVIAFTNATEPEIRSFISLLKRKIPKGQASGVPRLISEIESIAEAFSFNIQCYDGSTTFVNEMV